MAGLLAIDPAWTAGRPSGVAALRRDPTGWRTVAVAPSAAAFVAQAAGEPVDWNAPSTPGLPAPAALVEAADRLVHGVELVAIDMPVALVPFDSRRAADREISRAFGAQGCSTHSPNARRPGRLGQTLTEGFASAGYAVATTATPVGTPGVLLEVYPHPALLRLLGAPYRVRYKTQGMRRYWPDRSPDDRRAELLANWHRIRTALAQVIGAANLPLPSVTSAAGVSLAALKGYEDALDALVCGWVGVTYLDGACECYGDETAAIWVPAVGSAPPARN